MTGLSTLPSTREQARHALLLLGVPTSPRLLVDVHQALFDGDLSVPAVAALIRGEERRFAAPAALRPDGSDPSAEPGAPPYLICPGLNPDLTPVRGMVTLSTWPVIDRIGTPATARSQALASVIRVAEFVAVRPGACATTLLRQMAQIVPGGPEAVDPLNPLAIAEIARVAMTDPALADAVAAEHPAREAAATRAAALDERIRLFGLPTVPHQRGAG
jgi:hypothetical protein